MSGKKIGYRRVSMATQTLDRQLDGLEFHRVFEDKCSGTDLNRPQFDEMMKFLRDGDTLTVHSLDRLARNLGDLRNTVKALTDKCVVVKFLKENLTFSKGIADPMSQLMLDMMGAFAQFERSLMLERQREGIAIAKAKGLYRGGRPKLTEEQAEDLKKKATLGIPKARLARDFGITRETVYQYLKSH